MVSSRDVEANTQADSPRGKAGGGSRELEPGTAVGEYRVVRKLAEGGMGVVYEGTHPLLQRKACIKVLNREFAYDDQASARFLEEARAATAVRHPNIVDVFAFGTLPDGRYYQVMELLEGRDLADILRERGVIGVEEARVIVGGALAGLQAAHERGVVHRDMKPDNIFVFGDLDRPDGLQVKILDFGLAKRRAGDSVVTSTIGVPMGTPAYMSPEQCRAVGPVDHRTDLYSMGVVLYRVLVGCLPFVADSVLDVMNMHLASEVSPPSRDCGMPAALEAVILKALAKDPAGRFDSADEMRTALDMACFQAVAWTPRRLEDLPPPELDVDSAPSAEAPSELKNTEHDAEPTDEIGLPSMAVPRTRSAFVVWGLLAIGVVAGVAYLINRPVRPVLVEAPRVRPAGLRIEIDPPLVAKVLFDRKPVGEGSLVQVPDIEPGMHEIDISAPGMESHHRLIKLSPGENRTLTVSLKAATPAKKPRGK